MKSSIQFYDGITTDDIHETLVKTAADLISEATPNYQYVAFSSGFVSSKKGSVWRYSAY